MNRHEPYTMKATESGLIFISRDRELDRRKEKMSKLFGAWADSVALNAEAMKLQRMPHVGEA